MPRANTDEHMAAGTPEQSWVNITCKSIGSTTEGCGPPPSAIAAVKTLLEEYTSMYRSDAERAMPARTLVDAYLLEAWRLAAADPDDQIFIWLRDGAPTGITAQLHDPGIFPECSRPADVQPQDLHCDEQQFRNYPGVEEQDITDA